MNFIPDDQRKLNNLNDSEILVSGVRIEETDKTELTSFTPRDKDISLCSPDMDMLQEDVLLTFYIDSGSVKAKHRRLYIVSECTDDDIVQLESVDGTEFMTIGDYIPGDFRYVRDHTIATVLGNSNVTLATVL